MDYKNIKRSILLSFLFFAGSMQGGYAQEASGTETASFVPPFDFPITFSGNFGEIRANHFHGGLDFKTGGAIGKPVRALADGYISRIRVTHGSGYVLDVAYDSGYSTINRHLSAFVGDVARRVKALQYEQESWEVEITPEPGEYPVKAGQVIALSGNTGYSFGPHLHLDMIESATGDYIDPLPFFMEKVKDTVAPRAEGIMLFPQPGRGAVNGKQSRQAFPVRPAKPVTAWGLIGVGIRAYDHMNGVGNRYGVHTVILEVDGEEVFRSVVDRFAYEENRYINSWTHGQYMKSFIEPGNRLRMLHASNGNRGLVEIDEERPYRFVYTERCAGQHLESPFYRAGKENPHPSGGTSREVRLQMGQDQLPPGTGVGTGRAAGHAVRRRLAGLCRACRQRGRGFHLPVERQAHPHAWSLRDAHRAAPRLLGRQVEILRGWRYCQRR